jgi:anti-anti-sigma factor
MIDIKVEEKNGVMIFHISGEFHLETIRKVETYWNDNFVKEPRVVAFDFKDTVFIDSSAIGMLIRFYNAAQKKNIEILFYDLNPLLIQIFKSARLNKLFKLITKDEFETAYMSR